MLGAEGDAFNIGVLVLTLLLVELVYLYSEYNLVILSGILKYNLVPFLRVSPIFKGLILHNSFTKKTRNDEI